MKNRCKITHFLLSMSVQIKFRPKFYHKVKAIWIWRKYDTLIKTDIQLVTRPPEHQAIEQSNQVINAKLWILCMRLGNVSVMNSATDSQNIHYASLQMEMNSKGGHFNAISYRICIRLWCSLYVAINKLETNRDFNFTGRMNGFVFESASEINSNKFPESGVMLLLFQHNCIQMGETAHTKKKWRRELKWDDWQFRKQKRTPQTIITNYHLLRKHLYRAASRKLMRSLPLSMVFVRFTWICGHLFHSRLLIEMKPRCIKSLTKKIKKNLFDMVIGLGSELKWEIKRWINIFIQAGDANVELE